MSQKDKVKRLHELERIQFLSDQEIEEKERLEDELKLETNETNSVNPETPTEYFKPKRKRTIIEFLKDKYGKPKEERNLPTDRKSTRLNSSHVEISYAVFCLKKKKKTKNNKHKT